MTNLPNLTSTDIKIRQHSFFLTIFFLTSYLSTQNKVVLSGVQCRNQIKHSLLSIIIVLVMMVMKFVTFVGVEIHVQKM